MAQYDEDFGNGRAGGGTAAASLSAGSGADDPHDNEARGFLNRLFGAREEAVAGLIALLFTLTIGAIVLKDAYFSQFMDKSGAQRVFAKRWNERTLVFPIEGTDALGRRALFDVVVLTKSYGWVLGSTTELERGNERLSPTDIQSEVLAPQMREGLGGARALIAVGLASQEGDIGRETQRGGLRASRIAEWVRGAVDPHIPMWTLNLGRYLEPCAECEDDETSWQRPFIVIAMREADNGVNIEQALRSAMSGKTNLPSPDRYSTFALARHSP
jgi:hypothetical protein